MSATPKHPNHSDRPGDHSLDRLVGPPLPPGTCPTCGYVMDEATSATDERHRPRPGDVSVCMRCGEIMVFCDGLKLSLAGMDDLLKLDDEMNQVLKLTQDLIRRERPLGTVWPNVVREPSRTHDVKQPET